MKVVGLITEYNPFHNGHLYHMEQARAITGADYCIAVMSGNYVQRGEPACMDKYLRAQIALLSGADLVLSFRFRLLREGAEYFASGAVSLLDKLGVVDSLCFGSESGDLPLLSYVASILADEPEEFSASLKGFLKNGSAIRLPERRRFFSILLKTPKSRGCPRTVFISVRSCPSVGSQQHSGNRIYQGTEPQAFHHSAGDAETYFGLSVQVFKRSSLFFHCHPARFSIQRLRPGRSHLSGTENGPVLCSGTELLPDGRKFQQTASDFCG